MFQVQTGFGRLGSHFWGFETHGVVPDIGKLLFTTGSNVSYGQIIEKLTNIITFSCGHNSVV